MDLQNNQRRQRYVNDKGIEREVGVLRDFFGGAETHPKQKANKEQHDVVHAPSPNVCRWLKQPEGHPPYGKTVIDTKSPGAIPDDVVANQTARSTIAKTESPRKIAASRCRTSPLTVLKLRCSAISIVSSPMQTGQLVPDGPYISTRPANVISFTLPNKR